MTAVLVKHLGVGATFVKILTSESSHPTPEVIYDIIRVVFNAKWSLIKLRQDRNCSYKELCAAMLDRCRFLLQDIRPAVSWESVGLKRLQLCRRPARWHNLIRRVIKQNRQHKIEKSADNVESMGLFKKFD